MHVDAVRDESEWRAKGPFRPVCERAKIHVGADHVIRPMPRTGHQGSRGEAGSSQYTGRGTPSRQRKSVPGPRGIEQARESQVVAKIAQGHCQLTAESPDPAFEAGEPRRPQMKIHRLLRASARGIKTGRARDSIHCFHAHFQPYAPPSAATEPPTNSTIDPFG